MTDDRKKLGTSKEEIDQLVTRCLETFSIEELRALVAEIEAAIGKGSKSSIRRTKPDE